MLEKLSLAQRAVLFILMGEAREVPNTYFANERGYKLDNRIRDNLEKLGLINVTHRKVGPRSTRIYLELSDLGWKECRAELASPDHRGEGAVGVALYTLLELLQRHLTTSGIAFTAFFAPAEEPVHEPVEEVEARIRAAYSSLARPGDWVKLAALRECLGSADRAEVDRVLVRLGRLPDVDIVPESNQKALGEKDVAAAVVIGNQRKHLISIRS